MFGRQGNRKSRVVVCWKLVRRQKKDLNVLHTFIIVNVLFHQAFDVEDGEVDTSEVIQIQLCTGDVPRVWL